MADFTPVGSHTPTSIGTIVITLKDVDGDTANQTVNYQVRIKDENGQERSQWDQQGDLSDYLTAGQITTIQTFLAAMRTKAGALLP